MFCSHKFEKVNENGYQYCKKCGIARVAECAHEWVDIQKADIKNNGQIFGIVYIQSCKKCNEKRRQIVETYMST